MKKTFLVFGLAGMYAAAAQQNNLFNADEYLKKNNVNRPAIGFQWKAADQEKIIPPNNTGGNTILILPTDHMPCVTTDLNLPGAMPNLATPADDQARLQHLPGRIPNAAPLIKRYICPTHR